MSHFHPFSITLSIILSLFFGTINPLLAQQKIKDTIEVDDLTRTYRLFLPSSYTPDNPLPLVFNLHGFGSGTDQQQSYSEMNAVAEANNFIVCYPRGKSRSWNVGFPFPSKQDDVKFISELIDHLDNEYGVDLNRVYSCGFSNGGYMSYKLACELSNRIVAIASVAGTTSRGRLDDCTSEQPVPVLHIHGNADPIVPYYGSAVGIGVPKLLSFWQDKNGCDNEPIATPVKNEVRFDFSRAVRYDYTNCADKGNLIFYKVKNGGHTWPGAKLRLGITNKDFDASTEIWNFFKQFSFDSTTANQIRLKIPSAISSALKLVPNPNNGIVNIQLNLAKSTTLSRSLYTIQGQQILPTETTTFSKGFVDWTYPLPNIPTGIYFLKLVQDGALITRKVMVE